MLRVKRRRGARARVSVLLGVAVFFVLSVFSMGFAGAAVIRGDTSLDCEGEWGITDIHCTYSQASTRCDNYFQPIGILFGGIPSDLMNENYAITLAQEGRTSNVLSYPDSSNNNWAIINMPAPEKCFDYSTNTWISFNDNAEVSGTIRFELKRPECIVDSDCDSLEVCQDSKCVSLPPWNSPLKNSAVNAINLMRDNLIKSAVKVDSHSQLELPLTAVRCASEFIPSAIPNKDIYSDVALEIWEETTDEVMKNSINGSVELKVVEKYADTTGNITIPHFSNATQKIWEADNATINNLEDTEFGGDILNVHNFAGALGKEWPRTIQELNDAYDNMQTTKTLISIGVGIGTAVFIGPAAPVAVILVTHYVMPAGECLVDIYVAGAHAFIIGRMLVDYAAEALKYTGKIEKGITYLDSVGSNGDLPKITASVSDSSILDNSRTLFVENTGIKSVNVDLIYYADYKTDAQIAERAKNYQDRDSFRLSPGESRMVVFKPDERTNAWIKNIGNNLSSLCSDVQTDAIVYSEHTTYVFYGEDETVAMKEFSFRDILYHSLCQNTTAPVTPPVSSGGGGGGSSRPSTIRAAPENPVVPAAPPAPVVVNPVSLSPLVTQPALPMTIRPNPFALINYLFGGPQTQPPKVKTSTSSSPITGNVISGGGGSGGSIPAVVNRVSSAVVGSVASIFKGIFGIFGLR